VCCSAQMYNNKNYTHYTTDFNLAFLRTSSLES
jgi:hypothetical protein